MDIQKLVESVVGTIMTKYIHAQKDIRELMKKLLDKLYLYYPVFFEDLYQKYILNK